MEFYCYSPSETFVVLTGDLINLRNDIGNVYYNYNSHDE